MGELFLKQYQAEHMKPEMIGYTDLSNNPKLVETAGFIPLPERIKMMVLSGEQLANARDVFDSSDYREMYSDVGDNFLEYGDDIEEITLKFQNVLRKQKEILLRKGFLKSTEQHDQQSDSGAGSADSDSNKPQEIKD